MKLGSLKLKPNTKIMMMGTREESLVGEWVIEQRYLVWTMTKRLVAQLIGYVPR